MAGQAPLLLVALLAAAPLAGCLGGPGKHAGRPFACDPPSPGAAGEALRVRVAWAGSGVPMEGACVRADPAAQADGADARTRLATTGATGEAVLRLDPGEPWRVLAALEDPRDPFCAYDADPAEVPAEGRAAELALALRTDRRLCT